MLACSASDGSQRGGAGGSGAGNSGGSPASCVPGKVSACPCPGGGTGQQTCNADGKSFTACSCGTGTGGSGGSGGKTALCVDYGGGYCTCGYGPSQYSSDTCSSAGTCCIGDGSTYCSCLPTPSGTTCQQMAAGHPVVPKCPGSGIPLHSSGPKVPATWGCTVQSSQCDCIPGSSVGSPDCSAAPNATCCYLEWGAPSSVFVAYCECFLPGSNGCQATPQYHVSVPKCPP